MCQNAKVPILNPILSTVFRSSPASISTTRYSTLRWRALSSFPRSASPVEETLSKPRDPIRPALMYFDSLFSLQIASHRLPQSERREGGASICRERIASPPDTSCRHRSSTAITRTNGRGGRLCCRSRSRFLVESLSSQVRVAVATLGGQHGVARRDDKWRHLYAGFTIWLSESEAIDEISAKEEARKHIEDGTVAYSNAEVVLKLGGWEHDSTRTVAQACLSVLKQLVLPDKTLTGIASY